MEKLPEQMERAELIGTVHALLRQLEELTSPERTAAYTLGRLHLTSGEDRSIAPRLRNYLRLRLSTRG